jgi:ABC-type phosphate/phosphonate transport system substrate-binding protein
MTHKLTTLTPYIRKLLLLASLLSAILPLVAAYGNEPVKIGVLAFRSKDQTQAQWQPMVAALKQAIPQRDFILEALTITELEQAVSSRQLDYVLTNPGHYVLMAKRNGLSATLATLRADESGHPV